MDWNALFKIHYDNRVRSFREQNLVFQNVVLLGDSITEAFEVTHFLPGRRVLNRGIGADVIGNGLPSDDRRGVLRRLDSSVFDCAATDVFLMIGVNDLNANRTVNAMEAGYREILQQIRDKAPTVRVHVESLLPTRGVFANQNEHIKEFNGRLKRLAEEFGYKYLDLHPLFVNEKGELKAAFTADGIHLTEPAYEIWHGDREGDGLAAIGQVSARSGRGLPAASQHQSTRNRRNCSSSSVTPSPGPSGTRAPSGRRVSGSTSRSASW